MSFLSLSLAFPLYNKHAAAFKLSPCLLSMDRQPSITCLCLYFVFMKAGTELILNTVCACKLTIFVFLCRQAEQGTARAALAAFRALALSIAYLHLSGR